MVKVKHPHRLIVLLAALVAFGPLSIDMYLPSLPLIAADLDAAQADIQLTISSFLIGLFIGMLFYGPLSDKLGRRPLLLGGITLYLLASIACFLAVSAEWLVAARFLQALGAAAASVLARAIVRDLFPLNEAARVLSLMHLVTMLATLIAPLVGGYLIMLTGWRALFVVLFVFAALVLLFSAWKIPETHHGSSRGSSFLAVYKAYGLILLQPVAVGYILCMSLTFAGMFGTGGIPCRCFRSSVAAGWSDRLGRFALDRGRSTGLCQCDWRAGCQLYGQPFVAFSRAGRSRSRDCRGLPVWFRRTGQRAGQLAA